MPWTTSRDDLNNHNSIWLTLIARLKPGRNSAGRREVSLAPLWYSLRAQEAGRAQGGVGRDSRTAFLTTPRIFVKDDSTGFIA